MLQSARRLIVVFTKFVIAISALLYSICALSGDSSSGVSNPGVSIPTVTPDSACANVGAIAQTTGGSYATCESGFWRSRRISNPYYSATAKAFDYSGGGYGFAGAYTPCPAGKKVLFTACLVYGASGFFFHDQHGPAAGITGPPYNFPIDGDQGGYCLYVATNGSSGTLVVQAICGDR